MGRLVRIVLTMVSESSLMTITSRESAYTTAQEVEMGEWFAQVLIHQLPLLSIIFIRHFFQDISQDDIAQMNSYIS